MKYANKLSDNQLKELYQLFTDSDAKIVELNIIRWNNECIGLEGVIEFPEFDEEILKDNPNAMIQTDDDYELNDYYVKVYHHSGDCDKIYRKYMYEHFGNEYAKDYLLG